MKALHANYPFGQCQQWVKEPEFRCPWNGEDFHHKILRSQGGKDIAENLVRLCRVHHTEAHADFSKLERIRASTANLINGEVIS